MSASRVLCHVVRRGRRCNILVTNSISLLRRALYIGTLVPDHFARGIEVQRFLRLEAWCMLVLIGGQITGNLPKGGNYR